MKTIIFDLDGTILPMNYDGFTKAYYGLAVKHFSKYMKPEDFMLAMKESLTATHTNFEKDNNFDVFFKAFSKHYENLEEIKNHFIDFYNYFDVLKEHTWIDEYMVKSISLLKEKGYRLIIATNPILPISSNHMRIEWAGVNKDDFDYISHLEHNTLTKPNPMFYQEVLNDNGLVAEDCLMVGNDVKEDLAASQIGLKTYLITDCLLNKENIDYKSDYEGSYKDFYEFVLALPKLS